MKTMTYDNPQPTSQSQVTAMCSKQIDKSPQGRQGKTEEKDTENKDDKGIYCFKEIVINSVRCNKNVK